MSVSNGLGHTHVRTGKTCNNRSTHHDVRTTLEVYIKHTLYTRLLPNSSEIVYRRKAHHGRRGAAAAVVVIVLIAAAEVLLILIVVTDTPLPISNSHKTWCWFNGTFNQRPLLRVTLIPYSVPSPREQTKSAVIIERFSRCSDYDSFPLPQSCQNVNQ